MKKRLIGAGTAVLGIGVIVAGLMLGDVAEKPLEIAPDPESFFLTEEVPPSGGLLIDYRIGRNGVVTITRIETEKPLCMKTIERLKNTGKLVFAKDVVVVKQSTKKYARRARRVSPSSRRHVPQ